MRILVVEDDVDNARTIKIVLRDTVPEAELSFATNRATAASMLRAGLPDVLILDLKIPFDNNQASPDRAHGEALLQETRSARTRDVHLRYYGFRLHGACLRVPKSV